MNRLKSSLLSAVCTAFWMTNGAPPLLNEAVSPVSAPVMNVAIQYPEHVYRSGSRSKKEVALTFDDGPDNQYTPEILNILHKHGVKATFFVIGARAKANPGMVKRIAREGHVIGNHTWDHPDLMKLSPAQIRVELAQTDDALRSILGYNPALFRPPYGAASAQVVKEVTAMGYKVIDWSIDTRDWAGTPTPVILQYVHKELYPGGIILEHCAGGEEEDLSNTVRALPQIITSLKAKGYTFVTIPKLLNIPPVRTSHAK